MQAHDAEPLPSGLWLREMMALAEDCAGKPDMAESHAIRRAYYLCCLCPPALRVLLAPVFPEDELELLLADESTEQAAKLVIGRSGEIAIAPHCDTATYEGRFDAGDGTHASFIARLPALAMIGAWAGYFSQPRTP